MSPRRSPPSSPPVSPAVVEPPVHCAFTKMVPIEELKPYPRNNRIHDQRQIDFMKKAIMTQGWRAPITVSTRTQYVVRGHGRLQTAQALGLKQVPVDFQNYESEALEQADRIADNQLGELAAWDVDALREEFNSLRIAQLDLELTGFDEEMRLAVLGDEGASNAPIAPPVMGDVMRCVIVTCSSEEEQQRVYTELTQRGMECRLSIM